MFFQRLLVSIIYRYENQIILLSKQNTTALPSSSKNLKSSIFQLWSLTTWQPALYKSLYDHSVYVCVCVWEREDHRLMFNPPILWSECWQACRKKGPRDHNGGLWAGIWADGAVPPAPPIHSCEEITLWSQPRPCTQCKHLIEPLSLRADMLDGALLSLWRLTKVQAGKRLTLDFNCSLWQMSHMFNDPVIGSLTLSFQDQWQLNVEHTANVCYV